jgi:glycine/D-amino acid oxidase-like deaminating enzyme
VSGSAQIALETPEGRVRAGALVLAANAATPALGFFRRGLLPVTSHVVATAPLDAATWQRIGWGDWDGFYDDLDRLCFASRTAGGRLVMGGGSNAAYGYRWRGRPIADARSRDVAERAIRASLARYFAGADALPVAHRWTGTLAVTLDRVCSMGVGGPASNVYHALGYSGHGAALALLAGRVLADLYDGNHEAWRHLPFYQKKLLPLPPEPLRWLGYQAFTRLTGKSPRRRR